MPARLVIEGGTPLRGEVQVSAAKNAALPAMAASLLTAQPVVLATVTALADMVTMRKMTTSMDGIMPAKMWLSVTCGGDTPFK